MSGWCRSLTLAAALPLAVLCAVAQTSSGMGTPSPSGMSTGGSMGNAHTYDRPDPMSSYDPNLSRRQFVARRQDAHNRMVDNATRLLALTRELQEGVRVHDLNATDAKLLDDIAKLARAVRDQMRQ